MRSPQPDGLQKALVADFDLGVAIIVNLGFATHAGSERAGQQNEHEQVSHEISSNSVIELPRHTCAAANVSSGNLSKERARGMNYFGSVGS